MELALPVTQVTKPVEEPAFYQENKEIPSANLSILEVSAPNATMVTSTIKQQLHANL